MADKLELLMEAERRGILPEDKKALLSEARRRGLVPESSLGAGDVLGGAVKNLPGNILDVVKNITSSVAHPEATLEGLSDVAAGAISKALPSSADALRKQTPGAQETRQRTEGAAEQVGQHYKGAYGGGENIKRSIMERPAETLLDVATVLSPVAKRIPSLKVGKTLSPEASEAVAFAKKADLPVSPGALTGSKGANWLMAGVENIPGGDVVTNLYRSNLNKKMLKLREQFVTDMGLPAPGTSKSLKAQATETYGEMVRLGNELPGKQEYPNVAAAVKAIANSEDFSKLPGGRMGIKDTVVKAVKEMADNEGKMSIETVNDLSAKAWGGGTKGFAKTQKSGQVSEMGSLKEAIAADLKSVEEATGAKVSEAYQKAEGLSKAKHTAAVSDTIWNMLKSKDVYYFNQMNNTYYFRPAKFRELIDRTEGLLAKQLKNQPGKLEQIKKAAALMEKTAMDLAKHEKSSSMAGLLKSGGLRGTAAGVIYAKPVLAVPAGFDAILAHSMMNPKGLIKTWLTEGVEFSPSKAIARGTKANVLNVGGKSAIKEKEAEE